MAGAFTNVGADVTATHTSPQFALGSWHFADGGKIYIYVQANGAITGDGYVVSWEQDLDAIMTDTDTAATVAEGRFVGVVETDFADNEYGWVQIYGPCGIRSEQDALPDAKLYATADGGQVDDAPAVGKYIHGMHFGTATGGADAVNTTGWINFPSIEIQMEPETT